MRTKLCIIFVLLLLGGIISCRDNESSEFQSKVFKYDGSIQCENSGVELVDMAQELISVGIDVICSQKGHNGLNQAAVCGGSTGIINIYTVHTSNVKDAEAIGFAEVSKLVAYQDQKCEN